jgi:NADPH:quinone reductase-like Zn-dependent oxidoreductase
MVISAARSGHAGSTGSDRWTVKDRPNEGAFRELTCGSEEEFVKAPASLTIAEAATLPVAYVTDWHSLARAGLFVNDGRYRARPSW